MNKYVIRSTGLYAFLFPAGLKARADSSRKNEQLKPEHPPGRRLEICIWKLFIVFLCRCSAIMDNEVIVYLRG